MDEEEEKIRQLNIAKNVVLAICAAHYDLATTLGNKKHDDNLTTRLFAEICMLEVDKPQAISRFELLIRGNED